MSSLSHLEKKVPWYDRLFEPMYQVKDAARYSGSHPAAIARWIRHGDPRWRNRARGLPLSYLELIDAAFATYFRRSGIPFGMIRSARRNLANHFKSNHPFAEIGFKTDGPRILMDAPLIDPEATTIPEDAIWNSAPAHTLDFHVIRIPFVIEIGHSDPPIADLIESSLPSASTAVWFDLITEKSSEFDYEYDLALTWHPVGQSSSVVIDPRISFGVPAVVGVPTWVIKGRWIAGESLEDICDDYGLAEHIVWDALDFEGIDLQSDRW